MDPSFLLLRNEIIFNTENYIKFSPIIVKAAKTHQIDPNLIRAMVIIESKFNPTVGSHRGAKGLMQLMPSTARYLKVSNRSDPEQSIEGGTKYLKELLEKFNNNKELALAAYNAGPTAVRRYKSIPPYRETEQYVKKVMYIYSYLSP